MKKQSITSIKKGMSSYIREVVVQYKPLNTEKIQVNQPYNVSMFIQRTIGNDCRENFILLCIDNKNTIVGYSLISIGTVSEAVVHPREVFIPAIMTKASGVIVAHNHPSGTMEPSRQDIETTKRLVEAGKILGIPVVDHIIVGFNNSTIERYYSLKEHNYM